MKFRETSIQLRALLNVRSFQDCFNREVCDGAIGDLGHVLEVIAHILICGLHDWLRPEAASAQPTVLTSAPHLRRYGRICAYSINIVPSTVLYCAKPYLVYSR